MGVHRSPAADPPQLRGSHGIALNCERVPTAVWASPRPPPGFPSPRTQPLSLPARHWGWAPAWRGLCVQRGSLSSTAQGQGSGRLPFQSCLMTTVGLPPMLWGCPSFDGQLGFPTAMCTSYVLQGFEICSQASWQWNQSLGQFFFSFIAGN